MTTVTVCSLRFRIAAVAARRPILNAAARFVVWTCYHGMIVSSALHETLHWLPVHQRVTYTSCASWCTVSPVDTRLRVSTGRRGSTLSTAGIESTSADSGQHDMPRTSVIVGTTQSVLGRGPESLESIFRICASRGLWLRPLSVNWKLDCLLRRTVNRINFN